MTNSIIADKSKVFALRIIKMYRYLRNDKREFDLSLQILRSGTSIGANVRESLRAQSDADFYAKMTIALKEADETAYWLELLHESELITSDAFVSIYADCNELIKMLTAATKTLKEKLSKQ